MTLALYDLSPDYQCLGDLPLDDGAPSSLEGERDVLDQQLAALAGEVAVKVLALAKVVRTLEAEADLLEEHGRALVARAHARRRRVDFLRRWMQLQMEGAHLGKLKDPFVSIWLQASPASVEVLDEAAVPPEFKRVTLKLPLSLVPPGLLGLMQTCDVDRATIHELIKRTGELPAGIGYRQGHRHLRIR